MSLDNIPEELKLLSQWVCWKEGKIPMDPKNQNLARTNDPNTWGTYIQALGRVRLHKGLGFVFTPPYIGIDLDDCVINDKLNNFAQNIVDKYQSYAEFSPSKTGIHIICKGDLPKAYKSGFIEIYNNCRYFTMTGDIIPGSSKTINTLDLQPLIKEQFGDIHKRHLSNERQWIGKVLSEMASGNLCETELRVAGKLHRDGWSGEDIYSLLEPHAKQAGGDLSALKSRVNSIKQYPISYEVKKGAGPEPEMETLEDFLTSGETKTNWLVKDLIPTEGIGIIAGLGKSLKTWMMMDLALECAKGGGYWLGKFGVKSGVVLYLDQERTKTETRRRFTQLIQAKNLPAEMFKKTLHIMPRSTIRINEDDSFHNLQRKIDEVRPLIVCVDSFSTFHTTNENVKVDMQNVFEQMKTLRAEFGCTFVLLDHENKGILHPLMKDKEPDGHDTSGSPVKFNASEWFLTVRKKTDDSAMVYHTKATCGETHIPFLIKIEDLVKDEKTSIKAY